MPPWETQCSVVDEMRQSTESIGSSLDHLERGEACLQLSVSCYIGFGVEPNVHEMFRYLKRALPDSFVAQSIYTRIVAAIGAKTNETNIQLDFSTEIDKQLEPFNSTHTYFSERLRKFQKLLCQISTRKVWETDGIKFSLQNHESLDTLLQNHSSDHICVSVDGPGRISARTTVLELLAEAGECSSINRVVLNRPCSNAELSLALNQACSYGYFDAAMLLASQCRVFVHENNSEPTPLHWLIMFDTEECNQLARFLVLGSLGNAHHSIGLCKTLLDEMPPTGSEPTQFLMHCLQLSGSPLHWAVASRNLPLVKLLIELGANPSISRPKFRGSDIASVHIDLPSLTPLGLATHYHFPEIVDFFISQAGSDHSNKTSKSSFHYLGLYSIPFSRYIVHGSDYRNALKKTINLLIRSGHNIHEANDSGETAFMAALGEPDQEPYILEELLAAGARVQDRALQSGKNAVSIVASSSNKRPYQIERLALVLPHASNLNDLDNFGYNGLHYLAIYNAERMVKLILQDQRLNIDARTSRRQRDTAMHIGATFGSVNVLRLLILANAMIEVKDEDGRTPLEVAILCRQKEAADIFLAEDASIYFDLHDDGPRSTVLHSAVAGPSYPGSIASHLLEKHAVLRNPLLVNLFDRYGWTPLHKATFYGDVESVATLLSYGADHSAACTHPYPIAPGRTSLDIVKTLLRGLHTDSDLCFYHSRIKRGGKLAFNNFIHCLAEIRRILQSKVVEDSDSI